MTDRGGKNAIVTSAVIVGGTYGVLLWKGENKTPPGEFFVSWGVVFFILALMGEASPKFGGAMAILIAAGDLLGHATELETALTKNTKGTGGKGTVSTETVAARVPTGYHGGRPIAP